MYGGWDGVLKEWRRGRIEQQKYNRTKNRKYGEMELHSNEGCRSEWKWRWRDGESCTGKRSSGKLEKRRDRKRRVNRTNLCGDGEMGRYRAGEMEE